MADYRRTRVFKTNPQAEGILHMFFSPEPVPIGLTDSQVKICVRLNPYRQKFVERYHARQNARINLKTYRPLPLPTIHNALRLFETAPDYYETVTDAEDHLRSAWAIVEYLRLHPSIMPPSLPKELTPLTPITAEQFRKGIRLFIAECRKEESLAQASQ